MSFNYAIIFNSLEALRQFLIKAAGLTVTRNGSGHACTPRLIQPIRG